MLLLLASLALAEDVPVPLDQLPAPVKAAVLARWPGATLLAAEREGLIYDVELLTGSTERWEAEVTPEGIIREVERQGDEDPPPATAR